MKHEHAQAISTGNLYMALQKHWLLRWHSAYQRRLKSSLIASIFLLGLPFFIAFTVLCYVHGMVVWSRGSVFAFIWLCIAPLLIQRAYRLTIDIANRYPSTTDAVVRFNVLWQGRYLFVALPMATSGFLSWVIFPTAPLSFRIFYVLLSSTTQVLASMGFWGCIAGALLAGRVRKKLDFDIYHGDGFGGLRFLGQRMTAGFFFFSTGVLFIPVIFEIATALSGWNQSLIWLPYFLLVMIIGFILIGFFSFNYFLYTLAKTKLQEERTRIGRFLKESVAKMCDESTTMDEKEIQRFQLVSTVWENHLKSVRAWPFDLQVIVTLLGSLALPIIMVVLDIYRTVR